MRRAVVFWVLLWAALGRSAPLEQLRVPEVSLWGSDGRTHVLSQEIASHAFTVITFFSEDCPCMRDHDGVLSALAAELAPKNVEFVLVDPETQATLAHLHREAAARRYPFPILLDAGGRLSRAMEAEYATATVVIDSKGKVRYRGGVDSAKRRPGPGTTPYLRNALAALLSGHEPDPREPKSLGCYLRQR